MASTVSKAEAPAAAPAPAPAPVAKGVAVKGQRVLLFGVGGRVYGWEIAAVREIVPFRRTTRLPGAPSFVCGLINLRGIIVTVLDLGERLGVGAVRREEASVILVEHGAKLIGVAVDDVRDVRVVTPEQIEAARGDTAGGGVVRGIAHTEGDVVILLDVQSIVRQVLS